MVGFQKVRYLEGDVGEGGEEKKSQLGNRSMVWKVIS